MNPLARNWELSPPFLFVCHSQHPFCPLSSRLKFAAFWLIPYQPRSRKCLEITEFVDSKDLGGVGEEEVAESEGVGIDNDN